MYGEKKLCRGGRPKLIHCVKSVHQNLYTLCREGEPKLIYVEKGGKTQTYIHCVWREDPNLYILSREGSKLIYIV